MSGNTTTAPDEAARMAAVRRYEVLDTPPDGAYDRIAAIAARVCGTPISTITIVDVDRIWFRAAHGLEVDEIGRDPGLCASAILHPGPYVVEDAVNDPRALENPLVRGELGLRFYAAVPLTSGDGHRLGTLNVIDTEPRKLTADQLATLDDLARVVMDELEMRLEARRSVALAARREAAEFRDHLLSGLTHEMRTPLAVLHGIVAMDDAWGPGHGEHMREVARRHVRQLDWLVAQFLEFGRLEDGRVPAVRLDVVDPAACVEEAVAVFSDRTDIVVHGESVPAVMADERRTVQVLLEVLHHAIRANPREGVHVEIGPAEPGMVAIAVTDHGVPLPDERLARLLASPRHRPGPDDRSTIGLYVARAVMEAQHGSLRAGRAEGHGTRMTLRLPVAG